MRNLGLKSVWMVPMMVMASLSYGGAAARDAVQLAEPGQVKLNGFLGSRYELSLLNRLLVVNEDELLGGYRQRPGSQAWIGEHVGKWLDASSRVWLQTKNPELRLKMDRVADGLMLTQEEDGYLGTYEKGKRFGLFLDNEWDVWNHKYNLIGLLAYSKATGSKKALESSIQIGNLMLRMFGPDANGINKAGTHRGMAATSILEPMVYLYRTTSDARYLRFCKGIVKELDRQDGPHLLSSITSSRTVSTAPSGKTYEMLSNLVGLCELYRTTNDKEYLNPVLLAWQDAVKRRLYVTGTCSSCEYWTKDNHLPCDQSSNVGETCVTVTWLQLNAQLYRLFGEAKYADQIEKTVYNHLLAAQSPDGSSWCTYIALNGPRWYRTDTNCCLSSGPRGISMLPGIVYAIGKDDVYINLFETSEMNFEIRGAKVRISQSCAFPFTDRATYTVGTSGKTRFAVNLRIPSWMRQPICTVNGKKVSAIKPGRYCRIDRTWLKGDQIELKWTMEPSFTKGVGADSNLLAVSIGPVVMSVDSSLNASIFPFRFMGITDASQWSVRNSDPQTGTVELGIAGYWLNPRNQKITEQMLRLVPFYAAAQARSQSWVWLVRPGVKPTLPLNESLFGYGNESSSRLGNQTGSIADGNTGSRSVTYNGKRQEEDWFAVQVDRPFLISRIVYRHGCSYHDGGWFDTAKGKPRIQVQTEIDGEWKDVAKLESYPETNGVKMPPISEGQAFEVSFQPIKAVGIRIIGRPSCGDDPKQTFASCSELQAFGPNEKDK